MNKANFNKKNNSKHSVRLYKSVFYSRVSTTAVLLLVTSFLLQPIERIYASELDISVEAPTPTEIVTLAVDSSLGTGETVDVVEVVNDSVVADPIQEVAGNIVVDESEHLSAADNSEKIVDVDTTKVVAPTTTDVATSDNSDLDSSPTTQMSDEEIQSLIDDSVYTPTSSELPLASVVLDADIVGASAVPVTNVNSDSLMQFNKDDCVTVENGSFYCQTKTKDTAVAEDGLYALQDVDGDLEIYMKKSGELKQITFNTIDDAAPYFDTRSDSIVWHRLVDDRYQIISYDIKTAEEIQLTADSVNNMEPTRYGKYTVWQRWHGDNWDVVLYDGTEIRFLTDSLMHDIAPKINGNLVVWNRLSANNTQTIELYDVDTDEYTTISDEEGGALSNPRMVLVYETEFANGDIVTKGYDMDTGKIEPLSTRAADVPDEIPAPDATGETRALIQTKTQTKDDGEVADDLLPNNKVGSEGNAVVRDLDLTIAPSTLDLSNVGAVSTSTMEVPASVAEMTLDLSAGTTTDEVFVDSMTDDLTLVIEPLALDSGAVYDEITE